ncbi:Uncharacterised protein [Escherichia coli]|uniref:Uncharacterized protein n=1 Tax=Escherichia coli TaxID=562 RepID=A0A2X1KDV8_ECOLX|nr:Uncharacterised protein [Escherichia coli]
MRKRHRIKCQNQEYQRLKQDFCIFSGCKTINLPRIIFTLVQKAVMQAMLTTLPELNLFKADAKNRPKSSAMALRPVETSASAPGIYFQGYRGQKCDWTASKPMHQSGYHAGGYENISSLRESKVVLLYDHHHLALKGMPRNSRLTRGLFSILMCFTAAEVGVKHHAFFVVMFE